MKIKHIQGLADALPGNWTPKSPVINKTIDGTEIKITICNPIPSIEMTWNIRGVTGIPSFSSSPVTRSLPAQDATNPYNVLVVYDIIADDIIVYTTSPSAIPPELTKKDYEIEINRFQIPKIGGEIVIPESQNLEKALKEEVELAATTSDLNLLNDSKYVTPKKLKLFKDAIASPVKEISLNFNYLIVNYSSNIQRFKIKFSSGNHYINWGDGSLPEKITSDTYISHTYSANGNYIAKLISDNYLAISAIDHKNGKIFGIMDFSLLENIENIDFSYNSIENFKFPKANNVKNCFLYFNPLQGILDLSNLLFNQGLTDQCNITDLSTTKLIGLRGTFNVLNCEVDAQFIDLSGVDRFITALNIYNCSSLEHIKFGNSIFESSCQVDFSSCVGLTYLDLRDCILKIKFSDIILNECSSLEYINVSGIIIDKKFLKGLNYPNYIPYPALFQNIRNGDYFTVEKGYNLISIVAKSKTTTPGNIKLGTNATNEKSNLLITSGCTTDGNLIITLDGVEFNITVTTEANTPELVAALIRDSVYDDDIQQWTTGGEGANITFESSKYKTSTDSIYSENGTGATGTMTTTQQGSDTNNNICGNTALPVVINNRKILNYFGTDAEWSISGLYCLNMNSENRIFVGIDSPALVDLEVVMQKFCE